MAGFKSDFDRETFRSLGSERTNSKPQKKAFKSAKNHVSKEVKLYSPKTSSELVVQKKKVSELKSWLETTFSSDKQVSFLLLVGPPGSGKNTTLQLLCKEMGVDILSWEEPIKRFNGGDWENEIDPSNYFNTAPEMGFFDHLEEFFERSTRYCSLNIKSSILPTSNKKGIPRKLLLFTEFPMVIYKNLDRWHSLLRKLSVVGKIPVVFIITDQNSFNSKLLKLFPHSLQDQLQMVTISFSSVANTFVLKALQCASKERKSCLPIDVLQRIVSDCNGDLRSALNEMYWLANNDGVAEMPLQPKKRKLVTDDKKRKLPQSSYARDGSYDFMHAIGKILNSKRVEDGSQSCVNLPSHLVKDESRSPLKENVEELVSKISDSTPKVLLYLHHNYPPFFNKFEDVARAIDYLSTSDLLINQVFLHDLFEQSSLLTGIRGVMHSNTSVNSSSWRPLHKPDFYSIDEKQKELRLKVHASGSHTDVRFFAETLPFVNMMRKKRGDQPSSGVNFLKAQDSLVESQPSSSKEEWNDEEIVIEDYDD